MTLKPFGLKPFALKASVSLETHAVSDAFYLAAMIAIAVLADFFGHSAAAVYAAGLSAGGILLYLTSGAPLGIFPIMPIHWHSPLEYLTAPLTLVIPPVFFSDCLVAGIGLPILGAINLLVNALTEYPQRVRATSN